jgi:DnaJ-class molecular chaperone
MMGVGIPQPGSVLVLECSQCSGKGVKTFDLPALNEDGSFRRMCFMQTECDGCNGAGEIKHRVKRIEITS